MAALVLICAGLIVGGMLLWARDKTNPNSTPTDLQAKIDALKAQSREMNQSRGAGGADIRMADPDSMDARAQRTLQDLKARAGSMGAPIGNDDVRLQSGGTITKDQYQRALDSVKNSGRYHPP